MLQRAEIDRKAKAKLEKEEYEVTSSTEHEGFR